MEQFLFFGGWLCSVGFLFYWTDKELYGSLKGWAIFLVAHLLFGSAMFYDEYSERSFIEAIGFAIFSSVVAGAIVFIVLKVLAGMSGSSGGSSGGASDTSVFAYECRQCGWYQERSQRKTIYKCPGCGRRGGIIPKDVG